MTIGTPFSVKVVQEGNIPLMVVTTVIHAFVAFFILALFEDPVHEALALALIAELYIIISVIGNSNKKIFKSK